MKFIYTQDCHTVFNFGLIKLKFNFKWKSNKIFIKKKNGELKRLNKLPKGVTVNFHGVNSEIVFSESSIFKNCMFEVYDDCRVFIGTTNKWKVLNLYAILENNSVLNIGEDFNCAGVSVICGFNSKVMIGNHCMFSNNIVIRSSDQHPIYDIETNACLNRPEDISIGNKVWICQDARILKGVSIADNVVIANGAVVTKPILKSNTIYAGIPAIEVKSDIYWDREFSSCDKEVNLA